MIKPTKDNTTIEIKVDGKLVAISQFKDGQYHTSFAGDGVEIIQLKKFAQLCHATEAFYLAMEGRQNVHNDYSATKRR